LSNTSGIGEEVVGEESVEIEDGVAVEADLVGGAEQERIASLWFKIIYASRCARPSASSPNSMRRLVSRSE